LGVIQSKGIEDKKTEEDVILGALGSPIGSESLGKLVKKGERVCIIISDITRTWQKTGIYLPYIVDELNKTGIKDEDITFLCATGSHRGQTVEEHKIILGEKLAERFEVVDHDCRDSENMVYVGTTSFGTPVSINRTAFESDHIILTGAIVFHDLVGWGGGKKSILPGIASYESIMANHKLSLNPERGEGINFSVRCGNIIDNPVHLDMMEAADFVKPVFMFNVIIDEDGNIGKAVAGDYVKAHEEGRQIVQEADSMIIKERADMVIASAGGYPKDIELYQASKALVNAKEAVRKGGVIILLAECIEGFGGEAVQQMLQEHKDMISREKALREEFSIAKYTGFLIAQIAEAYKVILVSSLKPDSLVNANIEVVSSVDEAIALAAQQLPIEAKVYLMPYAANTLPIITDK
ncbi:MAG: hypothetical protein K0R84_2328, partial [Clostridia bacterium]|nr:hypothetical protein [Clostridia bacterium]